MKFLHSLTPTFWYVLAGIAVFGLLLWALLDGAMNAAERSGGAEVRAEAAEVEVIQVEKANEARGKAATRSDDERRGDCMRWARDSENC